MAMSAKFISPHVVDVPAQYYYYPPGNYPEFVATGKVKGDLIEYVRRTLPSIVDVRVSSQKRMYDSFGRRYVGPVCPAGFMWCWRENKLCPAPHLCPDLPGVRKKLYRGWATHFEHGLSSDELCPVCDHRIKVTITHTCRKGWWVSGRKDRDMFLGVAKQPTNNSQAFKSFRKYYSWMFRDDGTLVTHDSFLSPSQLAAREEFFKKTTDFFLITLGDYLEYEGEGPLSYTCSACFVTKTSSSFSVSQLSKASPRCCDCVRGFTVSPGD